MRLSQNLIVAVLREIVGIVGESVNEGIDVADTVVGPVSPAVGVAVCRAATGRLHSRHCRGTFLGLPDIADMMALGVGCAITFFRTVGSDGLVVEVLYRQFVVEVGQILLYTILRVQKRPLIKYTLGFKVKVVAGKSNNCSRNSRKYYS